MPPPFKPEAELSIDVPLVRCLLEAQCLELARLSLVAVGEGWDNRLFRLGDTFMVRLPRRAASAGLVANEHRWLSELASRLPLPVPAPIHLGRPGCGFPWLWSVTRWLEGESALTTPTQDPAETGLTLQEFLTALHQPAPFDAPFNPWRSVPLVARWPLLQQNLGQIAGLVDGPAIERVIYRAAAAPLWPGRAVWIHGDLHPGNILVNAGRVSAVIDFGDLAAGDPATDWAVAWMLPGTLDIMTRGLDADTRLRARGWALCLGAAYLANSGDDEAMKRLGLATIARAIEDR
jgi:aminoglycoside phosphotransferase (APT) family kinase protein